MNENQNVTPKELAKIRKLEDFDLIMLISDIHDNGWNVARHTLRIMPPDAEPIPPASADLSRELRANIDTIFQKTKKETRQ